MIGNLLFLLNYIVCDFICCFFLASVVWKLFFGNISINNLNILFNTWFFLSFFCIYWFYRQFLGFYWLRSFSIDTFSHNIRMRLNNRSTFCYPFLLNMILLIRNYSQWNIRIWWCKLRRSHNIYRIFSKFHIFYTWLPTLFICLAIIRASIASIFRKAGSIRYLLICRILWTVWWLYLPSIYLRFWSFFLSIEYCSILKVFRGAILCSIKLCEWSRRRRIYNLTDLTRERSIEEMHYLVSCIIIREFEIFLDWSSYFQSNIRTC